MNEEWSEKTAWRVITKTGSAQERSFISAAAFAVVVMVIVLASATPFAYGQNAPSYCVISDVHVSTIAPSGYTSTIVQVTTTFYVSCTGGTQGTVWDIQTKVYAESNLVGVSTLSGSDNQYSYGQGNVQYVVNNEFDAMNYYGYGEQTPSFYVKITAINTSTGSLDAQEEAPFAVDTSQYPFNLVQQNYCNFPGLSQFFQQDLPGCSVGNSGTEPSNESSNQQPLAQQPGSALPAPTISPSVATNQSQFSDDSIEWISGIIIAASATFLAAILVSIRTRQLTRSYFHARRQRRGKFCTACGLQLQASQNFCGRCGQPSTMFEDTPS